MKLFDPDLRLRWLFCLTHPDDELAIAGWIRRLARSGVEVHLSWTTASPERRWEAIEAAERLGVVRERLHFLSGRDREVETQLSRLFPEFQDLVSQVHPDRIVAGAFEQGHLDHDATNFLLAKAAAGHSSETVLLETPFYHAYCQVIPTMNRFASPSEREEELTLDAEERAFKVELARVYQSQNIWGNLLLYGLLERLRGAAEPLGAVERLRVQTHFDFTIPNLPPALAARVLRTSRWQRWSAAVADFSPRLFPKEKGDGDRG